MAKLEPQLSPSFEISRGQNNEWVVLLKQNIDLETAGSLLHHLNPLIRSQKEPVLFLDLSHLDYLDEVGNITISELQEAVRKHEGSFEIIHADQSIKQNYVRYLSGEDDRCAIIDKKTPTIFISLGDATIKEIDNIRFMVSFLGSVVLSLIHVILHPKSFRLEDTITIMKKTGVDALPIVALISFLLGLIMAFMSAMQLQQFGANIYVASLVALAMTSELGPIMTAIIVAGRSGSAFAAEIGTMQISEEIDALFTLGFNPTIFLVIPRVMAALMVVPFLTLFSDFFAISGGLMVGLFMLDLAPSSYIEQTIDSITLFELLWGLMKSVVFALLISWTGCLRGFQVRGGPESVGNAATSAVVSSIFLIILFDSIFAVIRSYW
jgi:phospholipid/cholesterol/gamma-HCH transport system permease protein